MLCDIGTPASLAYSWDTNELANDSRYDRRRRSIDTMRSNMFTGTEDDQDERHDQGTIEVLGDSDTERGGDAQSRQTGQNLTEERTTEIDSVRHSKNGMIIRLAGSAGTIL